MKFESKMLNEEIMSDLENGGVKYKELNEFIRSKFEYVDKEDYLNWLYEYDLRVHQGIDYHVVIDSWFHTQNFYSGNNGLGCNITEKEDTFVINPPDGYEEFYTNRKMEYPKTRDGLIEAFHNTCMSHCVFQSDILDDLYVCISEM